MKRDHVVIWKKPQRPDWMSEAEYVLIPAVLELREILYIIHRAGQQDEVTEVDWFSWRENRLE
ncbi:MAG: hypothetical protein LBG58_12065 [Planctomycetaceae bacterium]|jgi:hypothetical protein|nr:hypothetical protein [Planctomycetaceae bacterium]